MKIIFKHSSFVIGMAILLIYVLPLFGTSPKDGPMPEQVQRFLNTIKPSYSKGNLPAIMRQFKQAKMAQEKKGALAVESVKALNLNFPVLVGKFSDSGADPWTIADLQDELWDGPWATGTLRQYYEQVSYGNFIADGTVYGWYTAPNTRAYYGNNDYGETYAPEFVHDMIAAADGTVDFSDFDNDGDGEVECVIVIHDGIGGECGAPPANSNDIWAHRWSLSDAPGVAPYVTDDGVTVDTYTIQPALSCPDPTSIMIQIGIFAHELGHSLGLPDLYDTATKTAGGSTTTATYSSGIGHWGIMGSGNWNTPEHPAHMCAFHKSLLGWLSPSVVSTDLINWPIASASIRPVAFKMWTNGSPGSEYFLVEYRTRDGFDVDLHGEGLVIYHVDEGVSTNQDETHKRCDVECEDQSGADHITDADHLDIGIAYAGGNRGDAGDPFCNGDVFNAASSPSNVAYNGVNTTVQVRDISGCGSEQGILADLLVGKPGTHVNLCIRDCESDVCDEPSAPAPCQKWWASPDVYIDNNEDGIIDPPAEGIHNKLFARVRNTGGNDAANVDVDFYFADPSMGLLFPSSADIIDTDNIPLIDNGGSEPAMVEWEIPYPPPDINHYCVGVIASCTEDPQISEVTTEDNNVAQINIQELYAKAGDVVPLRLNNGEDVAVTSSSSAEEFYSELIVKLCCVSRKQYCPGCEIRIGSPPKYDDAVIRRPWQVELEFTKINLEGPRCVPLRIKVRNTKPVHLDSAIVPLTMVCEDVPVGGNILKYYIDNVPPQEPGKFSVVQIIPSGRDDKPGEKAIHISWSDIFKDEMGFPERTERWRIYRGTNRDFPVEGDKYLLIETCIDENPKTKAYDHYANVPENLKAIYYKIVAVDRAGNLSKPASAVLEIIDLTGVQQSTISPVNFRLAQNSPNPFNSVTEITYELPANDVVSLTVYSIHGQVIRELVHGTQNAGEHRVVWDGRNDAGVEVASGIYVYQLVYRGMCLHHRMLLLK